MTRRLLVNCRLADPGGEPVDVLLDGGHIAAIGPGLDGSNAHRLDTAGRRLVPGFIDLHVHGAGGADILDGTPEAVATMSRTLARFGTTAFVGTTVPRPATGNRHLANAAALVGRPLGGARLLGLYLEGPFINADKRGGLLPEGIAPPSTDMLDELLDLCAGTLRLMTVAPELAGACRIIERLVSQGVVAAFGHSNATAAETRDGIAAGISHVTHLYNAMPSLHHRAPGPLLEIFETPEVTVELISDGVHVDGRLIGWTWRTLGPERCMTVTDGMSATGLPDGEYVFNGRGGSARGGCVRYADGTLIGSALPLAEVVRRFHRFAGCSLAAAVDAASRIPATRLGARGRSGVLAEGEPADLVVLDEDGAVWATVVGGEVVYRRDEDEMDARALAAGPAGARGAAPGRPAGP